jgi:hypothetical protein
MTPSGIEPATLRHVAQFYRNVLPVNNGPVGNSVLCPALLQIWIHRCFPQSSPWRIMWPSWSLQLGSAGTNCGAVVPLPPKEITYSWQILVAIWVRRNYKWPWGDTTKHCLPSAATNRPMEVINCCRLISAVWSNEQFYWGFAVYCTSVYCTSVLLYISLLYISFIVHKLIVHHFIVHQTFCTATYCT